MPPANTFPKSPVVGVDLGFRPDWQIRIERNFTRTVLGAITDHDGTKVYSTKENEMQETQEGRFNVNNDAVEGDVKPEGNAIEHITRAEYIPSADLAHLNRAGGPADEDLVAELFEFHPWTQGMVEEGREVRLALAEAYKRILLLVPACPSRTRALNCLTDAMMLANTAITFKGVV